MPLRQLIAQLLEKLPADRPQPAAEVASRLEGSLHGDTVVARPRPARKRKLWPWAVAGFIVAGGATAAVLAMRSGEGCGPLVERARESVALADADEATRRCPDLAEAHNVRGNALQKLGRLDDAAAAYDRALALDPGLDASRFNLGLVKLRRKDASAADIFTDLLRRRPDYPDARLARAQAYLLAGRASDALTDLEEAVRQKPDDPAAKAALDELRKKLGR